MKESTETTMQAGDEKDMAAIKGKGQELCMALQARKDMSSAYTSLVAALSDESGFSKKSIRSYANALLQQEEQAAMGEAEELLMLLN